MRLLEADRVRRAPTQQRVAGQTLRAVLVQSIGCVGLVAGAHLAAHFASSADQESILRRIPQNVNCVPPGHSTMAQKRWQNAKCVVQDGLRIKPDQLHAYRALLVTPAVRIELHVSHAPKECFVMQQDCPSHLAFATQARIIQYLVQSQVMPA